MYELYEGHIADVPGIKIGHMQDETARTGVSVAIFEKGAVGGVDVRGGSPGTRETDLLRPENTVSVVHAVALCGGSAFGLDAAGGVMRYLEERDIGYETKVAKVPIVCAAVLFDLAVGSAKVRPDSAMGYEAASRAGDDRRQGPYGAGCGATCAKWMPGATPSRGGIGSASLALPGGGTVAALIAVNALGDIVDPKSGETIACGTINELPISSASAIGVIGMSGETGSNTTIGLVATDAALTKPGCKRLAMSAHDGLALAIRPAHTPYDGDTIFAVSTGEKECEPAILHAFVVEAVARATVNAVLAVKGASA